MTIATTPMWRWAVALAALVVALAGASAALAQIPSPPSTVAGSVNDDAGAIAEHLPVQAYVGDQRCDDNHGETGYTGDGSARVTYYYVTVLSNEQTPGCGKQGSAVRIKIGDRFVNETAKWEAGLVLLNATFGNAKPVALPTATPTPKPATNASGTPIAANQTAQATAGVATIPAGSPGAGSPIPTLAGGITNSPAGSGTAGGSSSDGGFPLWGVAILVLGGIAVVGGGVGYAMSRSNNDDIVDQHYTVPGPGQDYPLGPQGDPEAPDDGAPADDYQRPPLE
jgi:hypothetical protein